jgi:hypothetical protein
MSPNGQKRLSLSDEKSLFHSSGTYSICVQGVVAEHWSPYLQGMDIEMDGREGTQAVAVLTGELVDQTALLGVLNTLHNILHLAVLSVEYLPVNTE